MPFHCDCYKKVEKLCEDFESLVDVLIERGVVLENDMESEASSVNFEEEEEENLENRKLQKSSCQEDRFP